MIHTARAAEPRTNMASSAEPPRKPVLRTEVDLVAFFRYQTMIVKPPLR